MPSRRRKLLRKACQSATQLLLCLLLLQLPLHTRELLLQPALVLRRHAAHWYWQGRLCQGTSTRWPQSMTPTGMLQTATGMTQQCGIVGKLHDRPRPPLPLHWVLLAATWPSPQCFPAFPLN